MSDWQINHAEDKAAWTAFAAKSPQRSVFVTTPFLDALGVDYDLVTCRDGNRIVAGAVVLKENERPIQSVFPFTQYQGLLLADFAGLASHTRVSREFKFTERIVEALAQKHDRLCLCHSWRLQDLRPFQWYNYHVSDGNRFRLDLRYSGVLTRAAFGDEHTHLTAVRSVRRQEYNKAVCRLKFRIETDVSLMVDLYKRTFARQHIAVPDQEIALVQSILERSITGGFGKMAIALQDGIAVSAVFFLYDDRSAYYLFGANAPEYRNSFGGTFLLLSMIRNAFANGSSEVDLVGVNSPNRGDFKLSLNAALRPYFITTLNAT